MGYTILILEDNKADASLMKRYLERSKEHFEEIILTKNSKTYIDALAEHEPDLIISDFRLPDITGIDAIDLKNEFHPDTPLIIVSATVGDEKAAELIKRGAVDFLIKNNIKERLVQVCKRALMEAHEIHKRRTAELKLSKSEERYSLLYETSLDGIIIGLPNSEGEILDVNPSICELLGYSKKEFLKLKRSDILFENKINTKEILQIRQKNYQFKGEMVMKHKDGSEIPVETTSRIVETADGQLLSYSIIRDIRERKAAQRKLQDQQKVEQLKNDIAQILNNNTSYQQSLNDCLERINDYLGWDIGHIYVKDVNEESVLFKSSTLISKSVRGKSIQNFLHKTKNLVFKKKQGYVGQVAAQKEPLWLQNENITQNYLRKDEALNAGIKTGLLLPITLNGRTEIVLEFYSRTEEEQCKVIEDVLIDVSNQMSLLLERKHNLELLESEKERYRLISKNSTDMISRHAPDGTYLYVSPASETLMGYAPEELLGTNAYDYFHPDDLEKIADSHRDITTSEDISTVVYRIRQKKGGWNWVETTSKSLRNPDSGEVYEIQTSTRDISDRKNYEEKLKQQSKLNEKIVNSLPGIFFILNENGMVERVNKQLQEMLDYNPEVLQKSYFNFVATEDHEAALESFNEAFETGLAETELNIITKEGDKIPFLITGIVDELNGNRYIIGSGLNITDRKKIEDELKWEKRFIDRAINSIPGLFYVLDEDGNYVRINDDFINTLGYSREEIDTMNPIDFYEPEDQPRVTEAIQKAFTEGSASLISRIRTKSGKLPYYYLTGAHFEENGNNYILGTGIDISDQVHTRELYSQAQEIAKIGAWEYDLIKNELHWTEATKQIHEVDTDYKPNVDEALKFYKEGESRERINEVVENAIENGEPYDVELQIITAKGNEKWVRAMGKAEFSGDTCVRIYGSFQDINAKKITEQSLMKSLNDQETMLMEIHHRVKNNLALVSGFLQLQAFQTDSEETFNLLSDSQSRIKSISLIHEQLYQSESFSQISMKENIQKLVQHVESSVPTETDVRIKLKVSDIQLNINQAIPLALIVNELLTNSYKHAFKGREKGIINIALNKSGKGIIKLTLSDDGIGLPPDFDMNHSTSLGFTLLKTLASQLNANLERNNPKKGSSFTVEFKPVSELKGASSNFF
ncbi:MAG: PAS domain S-box protein [Gracilimonas sp.]|uniref:PAS domain S-box protein n=1 Tax=Gracilimonas TaxID=649462 RepID=UPI001B1E3AB2|nr:PAS domain S-box protein [Gracilimonas sp.]MBO6586867.1 PAS domain S-box protein [Gracilimonas sp.]MBO6614645.1 PAS domain S-box protein [Gracilimonas sp.]